MSWTETFSGQRVSFLDPDPDSIRLGDISTGLGNICRFTGQIREHYSVAEHSVLVSTLLPDELKLAGLLHDAHEAYTGDIHSGLKDLLGPAIVEIENRVQRAISQALGIDHHVFDDPLVKHADTLALAIEADQLKTTAATWERLNGVERPVPLPTLYMWSGTNAKRAFENRYRALRGIGDEEDSFP